jgi:acetyl-CoA C-acetyltransferase
MKQGGKLLSVYVQDYYLGKMGEHWGQGLFDLIAEAVANLDLEDVDACFVGNMLAGSLNKQHNLVNLVAKAMGRSLPVFHLSAACSSGGMAFASAVEAIKSGRFQKVLVLGVEKMTDAPVAEVQKDLAAALSQAEEAYLGMKMADAFSLLTTAYLANYKHSIASLDSWPAQMHELAFLDQKAHFNKKFTTAEIAASREIAPNVRMLHAAPVSDGVAAIVLSAKPAKMEVLAVESCVDHRFALSEREDLLQFPILSQCWERLSRKTGLTLSDLDVLELHDCFVIALVIALESLGLVLPGEGVNLLAQPVVNPYGGLKAGGHAIGATGVKQIINLCRYLEVEAKTYGLAVNVGGVGSNAVLSVIKKNFEF